MPEQTTLTERIRVYTLAILNARLALQAEDTSKAREVLREAERDYRDYLMTLNGLPD